MDGLLAKHQQQPVSVDDVDALDLVAQVDSISFLQMKLSALQLFATISSQNNFSFTKER